MPVRFHYVSTAAGAVVERRALPVAACGSAACLEHRAVRPHVLAGSAVASRRNVSGPIASTRLFAVKAAVIVHDRAGAPPVVERSIAPAAIAFLTARFQDGSVGAHVLAGLLVVATG